ncbi:MAG: ABC transporter substrate-binding protein [Eubacteriaceae bacterium]|nr:ABC transporter substrate-binding protein [Eubacteriaceae bacterium]
MRKIFSGLLAMLLMLSICSCTGTGGGGGGGSSNTGSESKVSGPLNLIEEGKLKIGIEIDYPPMEFFEDDGSTPTGFDVDMAKALAEILGLEPEFFDTSFDGIFQGLDTYKYDIVISCVTITADRAREMEFTRAYVNNWQALAVKAGTPHITGIDEMEGLNIAVQASTTSEIFIDELISTGRVSCTVHPYEKVTQVFDDLKNGRVDGALVDSIVAADYAMQDPGMYEISWTQSEDNDAVVEEIGIAIRKGNTELVNALNDAINEIEASGVLGSIKASYSIF